MYPSGPLALASSEDIAFEEHFDGDDTIKDNVPELLIKGITFLDGIPSGSWLKRQFPLADISLVFGEERVPISLKPIISNQVNFLSEVVLTDAGETVLYQHSGQTGRALIRMRRVRNTSGGHLSYIPFR